MASMRERMLAGELYLASDPEIGVEDLRCQALVERYNATTAGDTEGRAQLMGKLLGAVGAGAVVRPPVWFEKGYQTTIGTRTFVNLGAVVLDVARVAIGDDVQIGPNVQLLTATHPLDAETRRAGWEAAEPITIGDAVWLGGGAIVCPGVTVGPESVIGAGSVVTRDIPARVLAVGNPCRVVRGL